MCTAFFIYDEKNMYAIFGFFKRKTDKKGRKEFVGRHSKPIIHFNDFMRTSEKFKPFQFIAILDFSGKK